MPGPYRYPGVYVEEVPSSVRTITGVSTSDTAFVDFFAFGPTDRAVRVTSWADFERRFGGLHPESEAGYAIQQFFLNGGSIAWVVRVTAGGARAEASFGPTVDGDETLRIEAASEGTWGNNLQIGIDTNTGATTPTRFNLVVREVVTVDGEKRVRRLETYRNLSTDPDDTRFVERVVNPASLLVQVEVGATGGLPDTTAADVMALANDPDDTTFDGLGATSAEAGSDGSLPSSDTWRNAGTGAGAGANALIGTTVPKTGLNALDTVAPAVFNLLCIPATANLAEAEATRVLTAAGALCVKHRAFMLVDPPASLDEAPDPLAAVGTWMTTVAGAGIRRNGATYFPRLRIADAARGGSPRSVGASGTVAGVYARTDATRGVWKAPAGTDAVIRGATLPVKLTDDEQGGLNPIGLNVLRSFPIYGSVVWGARTLEGSDQMASEWKYVPVRRTALFIEESLFQGLKWVVFEPNDEPLWAQIRLNVGAFMHTLFRQGAFQGSTPRDAYLVKCDNETTTQNDIDLGIVNIVVGFFPLKPAEFVILHIQQIARPPEV